MLFEVVMVWLYVVLNVLFGSVVGVIRIVGVLMISVIFDLMENGLVLVELFVVVMVKLNVLVVVVVLLSVLLLVRVSFVGRELVVIV